MDEIPAFLRRTPTSPGEQLVTASPMENASGTIKPTKAPRQSRKDAYIARITISIPISPTDKDAYSNAVEAIDGLAAELPKDAIIEYTHRGLGKL